MARKRKVLRKQLEDLKEKYEKLAEIEKEEVEKENKLVEDVKAEINKIADDNGFFCGVKLTQQDLLKIIEIMFQTNEETIDIPFALYFKDDDDDKEKDDKENEENKTE